MNPQPETRNPKPETRKHVRKYAFYQKSLNTKLGFGFRMVGFSATVDAPRSSTRECWSTLSTWGVVYVLPATGRLCHVLSAQGAGIVTNPTKVTTQMPTCRSFSILNWVLQHSRVVNPWTVFRERERGLYQYRHASHVCTATEAAPREGACALYTLCRIFGGLVTVSLSQK